MQAWVPLGETIEDEIARLPPGEKEEFLEQRRRKTKSVRVAYILWFLMGSHRAYLQGWQEQVKSWSWFLLGFLAWVFARVTVFQMSSVPTWGLVWVWILIILPGLTNWISNLFEIPRDVAGQNRLAAEKFEKEHHLATEYDKVWDEFYRRFGFKPSGRSEDWPGIREPIPSVTYSVADILNRSDDFQNQVNRELQETFLVYLQHLVKEGDWVFALDWQHSCYKFFPHVPFDLNNMDDDYFLEGNGDWPVPVLPMGDYYIFLEKNFEFGIFGHPRQKTICVFGQGLLSELQKNKLAYFDKVVRTSGFPNPQAAE